MVPLPVETRQAGGVPGPQPRRGPPSTTMQGGHLSPSSARRRKEGSKCSTSGAKDKQPLHILQWNAEGIFHKKTPLKARLENEKIGIVCKEDTHLNPENRFSIRGYQAFTMDQTGHKGGVMILVKNEIPTKDFQIKMERSEGTGNVQAEIQGVDITINQTCIKIFNIYCPDNKDLSLHNFDVPQENCIVLGDLNSHSTCWGYEANNARGDEIEDWQSETNMVLKNDCYAENAICYIDDVITTVKGFQGRSRSIANIIKAVLSAQVCARGRDWLESVALLLSVSERDRVDDMALGEAKISIM